MKNGIFALALFFCVGVSFSLRIGFLPFTNQSSYSGHWELEKAIPLYLENFLKNQYSTTPFDSTWGFLKSVGKNPYGKRTLQEKREVSARFRTDLLITAQIEEFLIRKLIMGEGRLGGIKNYLGRVRIKLRVYSFQENRSVITREIQIKKKSTQTAVNLGRLSSDEAQFDQLRTEKFGSPHFEKTVAGETMRALGEAVGNIVAGLKAYETFSKKPTKLIKVAKILEVTKEEVYINAGHDDQVENGDIFSVFSLGDSLRDPETGDFLGISEKFLGKIRISLVKSSHFSRAVVIENVKPISLHDLVRIEK